MKRTGLVWCLALALAGCGGSSDGTSSGAGCAGSVDEPTTFQYREIDDVDADLLSLDVSAVDNSASCPAVVWVHGGSWREGDKVSRATVVKAELFNRLGYVFVSVNYRLATDDNDVRWPSFGTDVAAATEWVVDHANDIGVDPERVALVGHSSGAHLVSIVGTNPDLSADAGRARDAVECVVSLDSTSYDFIERRVGDGEIIDAAFGTDPAMLRDGSPTVQATEHTAEGDLAEFLIVTRGSQGRLTSSAIFAEALTSVGGSAAVADVSPYDHGDVSIRLGEPGETVITPLVTDFLGRCLDPETVAPGPTP